MFAWLHRKAPAILPLPARSRGVFSTEEPLPNVERSELVALVIERNIQKKAPHRGGLNEAGVAMDDMGNGLFPGMDGYGEALSDAQLAWFGMQGFIGFQTCAILSQHWLINKVCSIPARDAVRKGWKVTVPDGSPMPPKVEAYLRKRDKQMRLRRHCVDFVRKGRVFGLRLWMFNVNDMDPAFYGAPFNIDGVRAGTYKGMTQLDPYWVSPWLDGPAASDPRSPDFYEPTWWQVNGLKVHRSHIFLFRGEEVPDILKPTYMYGGISIPQQIAERVYCAERTANEAPMLAVSKRTNTLKVDIAAAMANADMFAAKMNAWAYYRNNYGVKILGEDEEMDQFDTDLGDMPELTMGQYQICAAIGRVPVTKLMGTSPKGMDATGEFEEADYHEELESIQEHDLTDPVERHYQLLIKSEGTKVPGMAGLEVAITWNELDAMTEDERAGVNLKKAQTDSALVMAGALEGQDVRDRLIADPDSGYNGLKRPAPKPDEDDGGDDDKPGQSKSKD